MKIEQQHDIIQALANDLSLLKSLGQGTFKLTIKHFDPSLQPVVKSLYDLRDANFKAVNTQSLKLVNIDYKVITLTPQEAKIQLKNNLFIFEQQQAEKEITQTRLKIEEKAKKLANTKDIQEKEAIIKEIGLLSQNHKKMINKNNARTTIEITSGIQYDDNKKVIPTYIDEIDREINGGFERHTINVISATPHNGKTTFGVEAASNQAMNDFRVLYLSLEQIAESINQSVLSFVSESIKHQPDNIKKRVFGTINPSEKHDKRYWDATKFKDWKETNEKKRLGLNILNETVMDFLEIEDTEFTGVDEILARINLAADQGFDIVYIDNFQNLKYTGERTQSFEKFSEGLLDIAKSTGLSIVALSQLTADKNGNVKTKYASKLNDDASNHLKITRVKKDEDETENPDMVEVYVEKTRRGRGFDTKIILPFIGNKGVIGYVHIPERTEKQNEERRSDYGSRNLVGGFFTKEGLK